MTDEQKQVLRTLYGHEFGRIVRKLGQGGVGAAYLADLTNPLQILASRITYGDESPQLFGLADIPYDEHEPREITNPEHRKRIHDAAHKIFIENGPPHDKKPAAALETYIMLLEAINKSLPKHKHEDHFDVVVKVLKHRTEADKDIEKILNEEARKRFIQEAKVLKKLNHDNIVKLYGVVDARSIGTCLVLEHIDGESLDAYLQKQPDHRIPPQRAVDMMLSLLGAVGYMHGQGVIHRDIKPSNILLRADLTPVIIDFGIVKDPEADQTIVGTRMGTPAYMCPEFIKDGITKENTNPAADVYSLGILFFEMLAGRRAYEGNQEEIFKAALKPRHPTRLTEFAGSISDELVYLVEAARAKETGKRLTMEQFIERLETIKEKKLYGRTSPKPSTTILLQKECIRAGALAKIYASEEEDIRKELESRKAEDQTAHVERYLAQLRATRIEVGLYSHARKELDDFLKYNPVADTALMQKISNISEMIDRGLAQQEARRHLGETKRRIRERDYVGAEESLKAAEPHVAALPKDEHPDIHKDYDGILNEYDTKHRMAATVVKSLQSAVESARSFAEESARLYSEGKLVEPEKLSMMIKQIRDTDALATKISGVSEMPLYQSLHKTALEVSEMLASLMK
ncbi:MAG: serine/threonine-protein kinase [Candidatus Woesearchaeota archaeon]